MGHLVTGQLFGNWICSHAELPGNSVRKDDMVIEIDDEHGFRDRVNDCLQKGQRHGWDDIRPGMIIGMDRCCVVFFTGAIPIFDSSEAVTAAREGDAAAASQFIKHGRAYITLLRDHIQKEDHCLFSMANQAFTATEQQQLIKSFSRVESEHIGAGVHRSDSYFTAITGSSSRGGNPGAACTVPVCLHVPNRHAGFQGIRMNHP